MNYQEIKPVSNSLILFASLLDKISLVFLTAALWQKEVINLYQVFYIDNLRGKRQNRHISEQGNKK